MRRLREQLALERLGPEQGAEIRHSHTLILSTSPRLSSSRRRSSSWVVEAGWAICAAFSSVPPFLRKAVIPVARKLWMPSLVAILLQERACQRPALAAAEVRNMPLSRPPRRSPEALPLGMIYYFTTLLLFGS